MLIIDVKDFRPPSITKVEVDEEDISAGLTALGEEWKTPLAIRLRIKVMTTRQNTFAKVERVNESDDEWRINIYVPILTSATSAARYCILANRFIARALAKVVKGRGYDADPEAEGPTLDFVSVKRAQGRR